MNTYGVLGRYIPAFGRIVGRMQYDLFHAYTVDAHTLFVREQPAPPRAAEVRPRVAAAVAPSCSSCRSPRSPTSRRCSTTSPRAAAAITRELGAVDAEAFCLEQGLSRYDARLVAWLVQQPPASCRSPRRRRTSPIPKVVNEFARTVGDETHLDYLYVLTVADVRGTNPEALELVEGVAVRRSSTSA